METEPIGRFGRPDDIAYGALYLASDESAYVTGTELVIEYIENQAKHHKKRSFEEEYVALMKKHNIQYEAKWVLG